eukprot:m.21409 g.21409  ORF g.21409 m.21409 type:complete len:464 (+) comp5684_c0_seq1:162-1553(+)
MQCTICLSDEGEVIQKGCHCRGDNGAVHLDCLLQLAAHSSATAGRWHAWEYCSTCDHAFNGASAYGLAKCWVDSVTDREKAVASGEGTAAVSEAEKTEALLLLGLETGYYLGQHTKAELIIAEVAETRRRTLGPEHIKTLRTELHLARVIRVQGRYADAIRLQKRVLATMERVVQNPHSHEMLVAKGSLADSYSVSWQHEAALPLLIDVYEKSHASLGPDDSFTLKSLRLLADGYDDVGQTDKALELSQDVLVRQRRVNGRAHPSTVSTMVSMSVFHMRRGEYAEAEAIAREVLTIEVRRLGALHPHTMIATHNVGLYTLLAGRPRDAEPILREAIAIADSCEGYDPHRRLFASASLGLALLRLGQADAAVAMLLDTHKKQLAAFESNADSPAFRTASFLGRALVAQGKVDEGKALLRETLATLTEVQGADAYEARYAADLLTECESTGVAEPEEASRFKMTP